MQHPDVCIAGAGIIGLSLALELSRRGARVTVLDRGPAMGEASTAAAGMLAACDPCNPPELQALSDLSIKLYPEYREHIANLSDMRVALQTELTLQGSTVARVDSISRFDLDFLLPGHSISGYHMIMLDEHSIDPRQLASALIRSCENTTVKVLSGTPLLSTESDAAGVTAITANDRISAAHFVDCSGAWSVSWPEVIIPRKGQMLSVALPQTPALSFVVRTEDVYIVPRTTGPTAGRAIIGATVEDVGFDRTVDPVAIRHLQSLAAKLLPYLADAPILEQWAGLRPATIDRLPLIGAHPDKPRHWMATGHFRNGVLLAPATAHLVAQLVSGETSAIDLESFRPSRFTRTDASGQAVQPAERPADIRPMV